MKGEKKILKKYKEEIKRRMDNRGIKEKQKENQVGEKRRRGERKERKEGELEEC